MAKQTVYHVTQDEDAWIVQKEDATQASSRHEKKNAAVKKARQLAKNQQPSRVMIHKADGTIQEGRSYEENT